MQTEAFSTEFNTVSANGHFHSGVYNAYLVRLSHVKETIDVRLTTYLSTLTKSLAELNDVSCPLGDIDILPCQLFPACSLVILSAVPTVPTASTVSTVSTVPSFVPRKPP